MTSWEIAFGLVTSCAGRAVGRVCRGGRYVVTSIQHKAEIVLKEWQNSSALFFIFVTAVVRWMRSLKCL